MGEETNDAMGDSDNVRRLVHRDDGSCSDHGAVGSKSSGKKVASGWFGGGVKRKQNAYELAECAATALGG